MLFKQLLSIIWFILNLKFAVDGYPQLQKTYNHSEMFQSDRISPNITNNGNLMKDVPYIDVKIQPELFTNDTHPVDLHATTQDDINMSEMEDLDVKDQIKFLKHLNFSDEFIVSMEFHLETNRIREPLERSTDYTIEGDLNIKYNQDYPDDSSEHMIPNYDDISTYLKNIDNSKNLPNNFINNHKKTQNMNQHKKTDETDNLVEKLSTNASLTSYNSTKGSDQHSQNQTKIEKSQNSSTSKSDTAGKSNPSLNFSLENTKVSEQNIQSENNKSDENIHKCEQLTCHELNHVICHEKLINGTNKLTNSFLVQENLQNNTSLLNMCLKIPAYEVNCQKLVTDVCESSFEKKEKELCESLQ
ncbi:hypothetical protein COBT_002514, partial [Conglomerata obtusa]